MKGVVVVGGRDTNVFPCLMESYATRMLQRNGGIEGHHRFLVTSNANIYFALIYGRTPLRRFFEQESNRKARSLLVDNFFQSKLSLPFNSQGTKDTAAASVRTAVKEEEGESGRA